MKYFLIAGEASGDLHGSHLMKALSAQDPQAQFVFYGGDAMQSVGGNCLCHYNKLAYMGFIPVILHLRTILKGMQTCKKAILQQRPDAVILIDYPGFNLKIARFVKTQQACPVFYYISPKIWAWKEWRIKTIRKYVDRLFSILPFEVDFFEKKHRYPISYVGNPTLDEVSEYQTEHGKPSPDGQTIALLPGSRKQELQDNLSLMLTAAKPLIKEGYVLSIAKAPSIDKDFYLSILSKACIDPVQTEWCSDTYSLLSRATAALVTSGTATLETALFNVPQIVCYAMRWGRLANLLRPLILKTPYISLVNLIADSPVAPELIGNHMNIKNLRKHLYSILPDGNKRNQMLRGYQLMRQKLGHPGAPEKAAKEMAQYLRTNTVKRKKDVP